LGLCPVLILIAWKVICLRCASAASVVTWTKSTWQSKTDIAELVYKLQSIQGGRSKPRKFLTEQTTRSLSTGNSQTAQLYHLPPNARMDFRSTHSVPRYLWWCNDTNSVFVRTSVEFLLQSYLDQQLENLLGLFESVEWFEDSPSLPAMHCSPPEGSHSFHGKQVLWGTQSLFSIGHTIELLRSERRARHWAFIAQGQTFSNSKQTCLNFFWLQWSHAKLHQLLCEPSTRIC